MLNEFCVLFPTAIQKLISDFKAAKLKEMKEAKMNKPTEEEVSENTEVEEDPNNEEYYDIEVNMKLSNLWV